MNMQNCLVHHVISTRLCCAPLYIGPPCALWCTMQVGGAQRSPVLLGIAHRIFLKPKVYIIFTHL